MDFARTSLGVELPVSYSLEPAGPGGAAPERGLLVLHGYADHARAARRRLLGAEPVPGHAVFAPNGLFPSPVRAGDRFKEAYSWYFRSSTGETMVAPELAAAALVRLVGQLGLSALEWTIAGFSQGGFFAPHVVRAGLRTRAIIAAGAGYPAPSYQGLPPLGVYAVHGLDDPDVDPAFARSSFEEIRSMGYGRELIELPGVGHAVDDAGRAGIRRWLAEAVPG